MLDKLSALPVSRMNIVLFSGPTLIGSGMLCIATFAPEAFAKWDYLRLFSVAVGITFPLVAVNVQLTSEIFRRLFSAGIKWAEKADFADEKGKSFPRVDWFEERATAGAIGSATVASLFPLFVPMIASLYLAMPIGRAVKWALWTEAAIFGLEALFLWGAHKVPPLGATADDATANGQTKDVAPTPITAARDSVRVEDFAQ